MRHKRPSSYIREGAKRKRPGFTEPEAKANKGHILIASAIFVQKKLGLFTAQHLLAVYFQRTDIKEHIRKFLESL
jgi:hypothetical protein